LPGTALKVFGGGGHAGDFSVQFFCCSFDFDWDQAEQYDAP
jgi:hypothetical protein